jgi:rhamnosyltransferase subunit B
MSGVFQKTAVFVCELRSDPGFAAPLLCIADELVRLAAQEGCRLRTVFVLNDPVYSGHEIAGRGHMILPAPVSRRPLEITSLGRSYANLLAATGFAHERELNMFIEAWDRLFAVLSADVIISDHSPLACVAARGRIPTFVTGSGFSAPPPGMANFPAIAGDGQAEANQSLLLETVNRVLHGRGVPGVRALPELFAGDGRAVFAVPQLDPYHAHRDERLLSPCIGINGPLALQDAPAIFFALPSTFSNLAAVARSLDRVGVPVSCYVPGPATVGLTLLKQSGARVHDARPDLHEVLSDATVVLAASADLALAAYLAGRPQLVLRDDLEASVMASELELRHVAIALDAGQEGRLADAISRLINDSSYGHGAQEEARRLHAMAASSGSAAIAARQCLDLLGSYSG